MADYQIIPYTPQYEDFFWQLHVLHNKAYTEKHFGWDEEERRTSQRARIAESQAFIITMQDKPVGCYFITDQKDHYKLARFFLLDEMQGKGLGKEILSKILTDYARPEKPIMVQIWQDNPVIKFWEKMGFRTFSEEEAFLYMRYPT